MVGEVLELVEEDFLLTLLFLGRALPLFFQSGRFMYFTIEPTFLL